MRRYAAGHYLTEFSDAAIDAFLSRGARQRATASIGRCASGGGFQAYGGAIAEVSPTRRLPSATAMPSSSSSAGRPGSIRREDEWRMASARAFGAVLAPFSSGVYVNSIFEQSPGEIRRAYGEAKLDRLAAPSIAGTRERVPPEPEHRSARGTQLLQPTDRKPPSGHSTGGI